MAGIDMLNNLLSNSVDGSFNSDINRTNLDDREEKFLPMEEDIIEELLIMAYIFGDDDGRLDTGLFGDSQIDINRMEKAINKKVADKNWRQRLKEAKTAAERKRIANTEAYRVYNNAVLDVAIANGGKDANGNPLMKTWETMDDNRVRDTHSYLNGMTIPVADEFYTYNGNHAPYPHGFDKPEEDINCRCIIKLKGQGRP